ncbi:MAG: hypothetical protein IPL55_02100 [Saprospiraceae bacterium]|nr:hypothetical protein [Saprospiraceae bacterium]
MKTGLHDSGGMKSGKILVMVYIADTINFCNVSFFKKSLEGLRPKTQTGNADMQDPFLVFFRTQYFLSQEEIFC